MPGCAQLPLIANEVYAGEPPLDTPIMYLASEWGCTPKWYAGFAWHSTAPGQEVQFYVYPEYVGYPEGNPPFHAPPYLGEWKYLPNQEEVK